MVSPTEVGTRCLVEQKLPQTAALCHSWMSWLWIAYTGSLAPGRPGSAMVAMCYRLWTLDNCNEWIYLLLNRFFRGLGNDWMNGHLPKALVPCPEGSPFSFLLDTGSFSLVPGSSSTPVHLPWKYFWWYDEMKVRVLGPDFKTLKKKIKNLKFFKT